MRTSIPPSKAHVVEWLKRRLSEGPVASDEVIREAASLDISPSRLRSAGKSIGVGVWKDGYQGKWYWGLPSGELSALERELGINRSKPEPVKFVFPERPSQEEKEAIPFDFESMRLSNYVKDKEE